MSPARARDTLPRPAMGRPPAIAAVSAPGIGDVETCVRAVTRTIAQARRRGAGLIVFPEATLGGYLREDMSGGTLTRGAPPVLADREEVLARLSAAAGDAVVCIGYTEAGAEHDGRPYAAAVCLSGDGVLGHQRKVHIPPSELGMIAPGEGFHAFDTPFGRLGMLVCYDKLFPEAARALALDGADTIACLAAWATCRVRPARWMRNDRQVRHFNAIDVARAIENQVVFVSSNQFGSHGRLRFPGHSKVVDPDGRVLASTGARAGMALARIDPRAAVRAARDEISHLGDRMPAAYETGIPAVGPAPATPAPAPGAGGAVSIALAR